ncbi:D-alanyl-D-alanine carboxypeptidase/D-alanyl-D-alanine endopeptidase [Roseitranquillus sediminis]|uniref:D-alanyl-D-alanine carboxypeptidase/D-alanyl-D-alanine endopeptidase n=1 Tax=Roseitranquillus sediminis TaxID=2809051 RepID=UPI001D0CC4E0|nr:D-alanyl-D-alanine carboxypeptidase/D-alanyl-D-alanine-endopeptidase [Roseitranquillus sediminis]MBM9595290.1 D-alanyl-D-alanine carboxypeptidase/D-alanyl-D-alanine-endopeptidase [Roseitranquillus sediminis]
MNAGRYTRRWLLGALASGAAGSALAGAPAVSLRPHPRGLGTVPVPRPTARLLAETAALPGDISFVVADVRSGEVIESLNPVLRQPPASTAKVLTALYALDTLGAGHRFATRLLAGGPVTRGRLQGDLILAGGGDPTLDTDALATLARKLREAGVTEVTGRFLLHLDTLPLIPQIDSEQPPHVGYNPAVAGLNLNYNRVHFEWARSEGGYDVTLDARSDAFSPRVSTSRMQVVDRRAPIYTYRRGEGVDEWTVARAALGGGGARWLPVRRPDLYAAEVFQVLARSNGIVLDRAEVLDAPLSGAEIARVESAPLQAILREMLLYSTNLTAEVVGLTASAARGPVPSSLAASAARMNDWIGTGLGGRQPALVDHSGLGGASRIAAADMVAALVRVGRSAPLAPLLKSVPVEADVPMSVVAKTGTLNFVSALAGYLTCPDGRELAFAILTSDLDRRESLSMEERERPRGGRAWSAASRGLQRNLLANWGARLGDRSG